MASVTEKKFTINSLKLYTQAVRDKFRTLNDARYQSLTSAATMQEEINGKADKATTVAGYGITDAYTKTEIDGKLSSTYKPAGTVEFANLPTPAANILGYVYNVSDEFTTTADFVEGAGKKHGPGANVVVVEIPGAQEGDPTTYKLDVLAGFIDTSEFLTDANFVDITTAEIDEIMGVITDTPAAATGD